MPQNQGRIKRNLQRAVEFQQSGRISRAEACLLSVLEDDVRQVDAWTLLGIIAYQRGDLQSAIDRFRKAIAITPRGDAYSFLGLAYRKLRKLDESIQAHRAAVALEPNSWKCLKNLGDTMQDRGDVAGAIDAYDRALRLAPDSTAVWHSYAILFHYLDRSPEAAECCQQALRARTVSENGSENAVDSLASSLSLFAFIKQQMCDWDGLDQMTAQLTQCVRSKSSDVLPFQVLTMPSAHDVQFTAAQSYGTTFLSRPNPWRNFRKPGAAAHERLRVGYVSSDFHAHPTAYLTAGLFELHDRTRFQIFGYSLGKDDESPIRQRIANAFDRFADCRTQSLSDVAEKIRGDEIDVLVDLKGYTKDSAPAIFAMRPAPVQVNYLGYPGTMGVAFMDYILVDEFIVPPDQQQFYSEKLVHLPGCYQINDAKRIIARPPSREECGLPRDAFVFCCFNYPYKITQEIFDIWMRLLRAIPDSVLWLLDGNRWASANLQSQARSRNVDPHRIVFAPKVAQAGHLARIGVADLVLDTYPVTAHTTASDALWAGCPLVTCAGNTFVSRVAGSVLRAAGLPELVASSLDRYEALAMRLASDRAELASLRRRLAETRMTCGLFNAAATTRAIEAAYEEMWAIYRSGRLPRSFALPLRSANTPNYASPLPDNAYPSQGLPAF